VTSADFNPAEFEKDDDKNFHIDFIHACSSLRAQNYQIPTCDRANTKVIAGKIIPAIATTTAMITGAVMCELYKIVQGFDKIEDYRNAFINLAIPIFVMTEPTPPKKNVDVDFDLIMGGAIKAIPHEWTIWDTIEVKEGSMTFQSLFDWLKEHYGLEVSMVSLGNLALYNQYLPNQKHAPRLQMLIEDVHAQVNPDGVIEGKHYIALDIGAALIECGTDVTTPQIKYVY
jgi:ubiquitin-activating enzyme E1